MDDAKTIDHDGDNKKLEHDGDNALEDNAKDVFGYTKTHHTIPDSESTECETYVGHNQSKISASLDVDTCLTSITDFPATETRAHVPRGKPKHSPSKYQR